MLTVTLDSKKRQIVVEVEVNQPGWKFPANFPTKVGGNGKKYYQIPVAYHELDLTTDGDKTLKTLASEWVATTGVVSDDPKVLATEIIVDAWNKGMHLLEGDIAKDPYAVKKGSAIKRENLAMKWLLASGNQALAAEYLAKPEAEQSAWLLAKYDEAQAAEKTE